MQAPGASVGNWQRVATPRTDEKWNTIPVGANDDPKSSTPMCIVEQPRSADDGQGARRRIAAAPQSGDGVAGERGAELGQVADIPQPDAAVGAADASVWPSGLNATARRRSPCAWDRRWVGSFGCPTAAACCPWCLLPAGDRRG